MWNKAHIPISSLQCRINTDNTGSWASSSQEINDSNEENFLGLCDKKKNTEIDIKVGIAVYIIALLSIISYVLFMIFGGVGIFSFPLDLIILFGLRTSRRLLSSAASSRARRARARGSNLSGSKRSA